MAAYIDNQGRTQQVPIVAEIYSEARKLGLTVPEYLNRTYADADMRNGTAAAQIFASEGLVTLQGKDNPFGLRPARVADILEGRTTLAGPANVKDVQNPHGAASRILFPAAIISAVESALAKDRETDAVCFDRMVAVEVPITNEMFEQPVITYSGQGGPESAKAQRVAQLGTPPAMLKITTADRVRKLASNAIGMEMSEQAMRASTLDLVAMTMARFLKVERDERVYRYISDLFNGNSDLVIGAVSAVTSASLDAASTGGALTHKAWVKWLARNRKFRKITHVIADIDTYLKIEGRTGRPGTNNYDPSLARIDPQAQVMNAGFGNDVQYMIVDAAADGGPVPANTIYGLDASSAVARVTNSAAAYQGSEEYVLRRSTAMRIDWSEDVYRAFGDSELRAFDVLTISA